MKKIIEYIAAMLVAIPIFAIIGASMYFLELHFGNYSILFLVFLIVILMACEIVLED